MKSLESPPWLFRSMPLWVPLLAGVAASLAPNLTSSLPDRDSGVFLYVGSLLLRGGTPYLDVWDHKGPLIYLINAVGVFLDPGGEKGIWFLEAMALSLSGWFLYRAMRDSFDRRAALAALALFYGGLILVLRPGNYTEEFALVFSTAALAIYAHGQGRLPSRIGRVGIGAALGAAAMLRFNLVGLEAAVVGCLVSMSLRQRTLLSALISGAWVAAGTLAVISPIALYLASRGALPSAIDAYLRFNEVYVTAGLAAPGSVILEGLQTLAPAGLPAFALIAWPLSAKGLLANQVEPRSRPLLLVGLVALPIEFALVAVSKRGLTHYYITWLPVLALLTATFFCTVLDWAGKPPRSARLLKSLMVVVVGSLLIPARQALPHMVRVIRAGPRDPRVVKRELAPYPEQTLLMWGAEVSYNYLSERPSPTRFAYQYPLYACGYSTPDMVHTVWVDIVRRHPLILDTSPTNRRVPPLDPSARAEVRELQEDCALSPAMESLMEAIWGSYREVARLPNSGWVVYQFSD